MTTEANNPLSEKISGDARDNAMPSITEFLQWLGASDDTTILGYAALAAMASATVAFVSAILAVHAALRTSSHMKVERRTWETQRIFYLHEFLAAPHYANARRTLRGLPENGKWGSPDVGKEEMDIVCAGYDQAGYLLLSGDYINGTDRSALLKSSWGESIIEQYERTYHRFLDLESQGMPEPHTTEKFFHHFNDLYFRTCETRPKKKPIHQEGNWRIKPTP